MSEIEKLIDEQLRKFMSPDPQGAMDTINQIAFYVYDHESKNNDLYQLAKILPEKELTKVVEYFDGASLRIPTKIELRNCLLLTIAFYLTEVKDFQWNQVKQYISLPDDEVSYAFLKKKLQQVRNNMKKEIIDGLFSLKESDIQVAINTKGLKA